MQASRVGRALGAVHRLQKAVRETTRIRARRAVQARIAATRLSIPARRAEPSWRRLSDSRRASRCRLGCGDSAVGFNRNPGSSRACKRVDQAQHRFAAKVRRPSSPQNGCRDRHLAGHCASICRDQRARASANLPPPVPSVPTKSVSQNLQTAVQPGPARGPTTNCSRQSGKKQPAARRWRPRPAGCRKFP